MRKLLSRSAWLGASAAAVFLALAIGPWAPFGGALTTQNLTTDQLDPSFALQNLTPGEAGASAETVLALAPDTTVINASLTFQASPWSRNQTIGSLGAAHNNEQFGYGIDTRGDFNNDGIPDLAISAPYWGVSGGGYGRVEVRFGRTLGNLPDAPDWVFYGANRSGFGVALAHGDYNGDGVDDLVVSDSDSGGGYTLSPPSVSIFFGPLSGTPPAADLVLSTVLSNRTMWGFALAGGLDLDADGFDDLVVAQPDFYEARGPGCPPATNCSGFVSGRLLVFWGGPGGLSWANLTFVEQLDLANYGYLLRPLGDQDGDGGEELAVGAPFALNSWGEVDVLAWSPMNRTVRVAQQLVGPVARAYFGYAIAAGEDASGDGRADLVISAVGAGYGWVLVYPGLGDGTYGAIPATTLSASTGVGVGYGYYGWSIEFIGDTDGDGVRELAVSQLLLPQYYSGLFVYPLNNLSSLPDVVRGPFYDFNSVRGMGDVNDDGFDDYAATNPDGYVGNYNPGYVRAYYGGPIVWPANVSLTVAGSVAFAAAGTVKGVITTADFAPTLNAYLATHGSEVGPDGRIAVPLNLSFTSGGTLLVKQLQLAFSVVPVPSNLQIRGVEGREALVLAWDLAPTPDVDRLAVWSNSSGSWAVLATRAGGDRSFYDPSAPRGITRCFRVTAEDTVAGIASPPSAEVCGSSIDPYPPPIPSDLRAVPNPATGAIELRWNASGERLDHFEVWRANGSGGDLVWLADVGAGARIYSDTGITDDLAYTYRVRAVSPIDVASGLSAPAVAQLPDRTPPGAPRLLSATGDPSGYSATVSWASDDPDAVAFVVEYGVEASPFAALEQGPTSKSPFQILGLSPGTLVRLRVIAIDDEGRRSLPSAAATISIVDLLPPSTPTNLEAFAHPDGGAVLLTWALSPEPDVVAYHIYFLDPESYSQPRPLTFVAAENSSFFMAGLRNHVSYSFQVAAVDAAGWESLRGFEVFVVPERQKPPPAPVLDPIPAVTNLSPFQVTGSCEPGLWVKLNLNGQDAALVACDAKGTFRGSLTPVEGENVLIARQVDPSSVRLPEWQVGLPAPTVHFWLDDLPPTVLWSRPAASVTGVSPEVVIEMGLSEPVEPSATSVVLRGPHGTEFAGALEYDPTTQVLRFRPSAALDWSNSYVVEVKARDVVGNSLQLHAFTFHTGAAPRPAEAPRPATFVPSAGGAAAIMIFAAAALIASARPDRRRR